MRKCDLAHPLSKPTKSAKSNAPWWQNRELKTLEPRMLSVVGVFFIHSWNGENTEKQQFLTGAPLAQSHPAIPQNLVIYNC